MYIYMFVVHSVYMQAKLYEMENFVGSGMLWYNTHTHSKVFGLYLICGTFGMELHHFSLPSHAYTHIHLILYVYLYIKCTCIYAPAIGFGRFVLLLLPLVTSTLLKCYCCGLFSFRIHSSNIKNGCGRHIYSAKWILISPYGKAAQTDTLAL